MAVNIYDLMLLSKQVPLNEISLALCLWPSRLSLHAAYSGRRRFFLFRVFVLFIAFWIRDEGTHITAFDMFGGRERERKRERPHNCENPNISTNMFLSHNLWDYTIRIHLSRFYVDTV